MRRLIWTTFLLGLVRSLLTEFDLQHPIEGNISDRQRKRDTKMKGNDSIILKKHKGLDAPLEDLISNKVLNEQVIQAQIGTLIRGNFVKHFTNSN